MKSKVRRGLIYILRKAVIMSSRARKSKGMACRAGDVVRMNGLFAK